MGLLAWIVLGLVVGILAKWIMPGPQGGGFVLTTLLGIAGAFVGGFIGSLLGLGSVSEFDIRGIALATVGALAAAVGSPRAARRRDLAAARLPRVGALPLGSRAALVTGVSRRAGIGFAIAKRLASLGADLCLHSFAPYDADQPWGADADGPEALAGELRARRRAGRDARGGPRRPGDTGACRRPRRWRGSAGSTSWC